jgi:hypothetical protein
MVHFAEKSIAESKEKHGVWNPMPELTITSPYVHSITSNMGQPYAIVDLSRGQGIRIWPQATYLGDHEK